MSSKTKIQWTESTWNPVSGCSKVSPGCKSCYAERLAKRLPASHAAGKPFSEVVCHPDRLAIPLHWRKPRRIFVCSMGDLFHPDVPFEFIARIWSVMHDCPQHTFQILTKRPARMAEWLFRVSTCEGMPLPNVWLGVTAEDQQRADERIPLLLKCPAAVRFVSVEPMLGPVRLGLEPGPAVGLPEGKAWRPANPGSLDWIICGGESGPGARPMHPDWVRSIRDMCKSAGVPFFFKQWGEWAPYDRGRIEGSTLATPYSLDGPPIHVGRRLAGCTLDGRTHDEFPEVSR